MARLGRVFAFSPDWHFCSDRPRLPSGCCGAREYRLAIPDDDAGAVCIAIGATDADWYLLGGFVGTPPSPDTGGVFVDGANLALLGAGGSNVVSSSLLAFLNTGNGFYLTGSDPSGTETITLFLGSSGQFATIFGADGSTVLPGKALAAGGIGVGNSAAATTPGTVTKKIEVFDASGISLGFIAVYDAIT